MPTTIPRPRLRPLELKWIDDRGRQVLLLRDPSGVASQSATVPSWVGLLLSLCDGRRDRPAIRAAFERQTGQPIAAQQFDLLVEQLDEALFLEGPRFEQARDKLLHDFRQAAFRPPALVDRVYPGEPVSLLETLSRYRRGDDPSPPTDVIRGIVSPHIDYQRGGPIYARTWQQAADAVRQAEVVIVFGTDHCGGAGKITLTRQSYATPLGVLPTAVEIVDQVAEAIGPDAAFEEELHHRTEHSIELAAVWLHAMGQGPPPQLVPVLCGSFYRFTDGTADLDTFDPYDRTIQALRRATEGKRVLAVAAADLAHVGPAFGDPEPYRAADRKTLEAKDTALLRSVCAGDARGFFEQLREEGDSRRICGLPPIYLTLRFLGETRGEVVGYDQCPADAAGGSLVSIAGVLFT
jgi:MEMO1 family protein